MATTWAQTRILPSSYSTFNISSYGNETRDYQEGELANWEADTDLNLVSTAKGEMLEIYDDQDSYDDSCDLTGATTNSTYYRVIKPVDGYKHDGTPNNGGITFTLTSGGFTLTENYARLYDLLINYTGLNDATNYYAVTIAGNLSMAASVIVWSSSNAGAGTISGFRATNSSGTAGFNNCIAYNLDGDGFYANNSTNSVYYRMCTSVANTGYGFYNASSTNKSFRASLTSDNGTNSNVSFNLGLNSNNLIWDIEGFVPSIEQDSVIEGTSFVSSSDVIYWTGDDASGRVRWGGDGSIDYGANEIHTKFADLPYAYITHSFGDATRSFQEGELSTWETLTDINLLSITTVSSDSSGTTLNVTSTVVFDDCEVNQSTIQVGSNSTAQVFTVTGVSSGTPGSLTVSPAIVGTITAGTEIRAGFVLDVYDDEAEGDISLWDEATGLSYTGATTNKKFFRVIRGLSFDGTITSGAGFRTNDDGGVITLTEDHSRCINLFAQCTHPTAGSSYASFTVQGGCHNGFVGCVALNATDMRGFKTGSDSAKGWKFFVNCCAYNNYIHGFSTYLTGPSLFLNCSSILNGQSNVNYWGFYQDTNQINVYINCWSYDNGFADVSNFSLQALASTSNNSEGNATRSDLFHIASNDTVLKRQGLNHAVRSAVNYWYYVYGGGKCTTDFENDTRGTTWDIGADQLPGWPGIFDGVTSPGYAININGSSVLKINSVA